MKNRALPAPTYDFQHPATIWKSVFLLAVIALVSVPGYLLANQGTFEFDEPYQILNAYDYKNVGLAPLYSWFSHWYGGLVDWRWLAFRYLAITSTVLAVAIGSFYYLFRSKKFVPVLIVAACCAFFGTVFRFEYTMYGWDNPTVLLVTVLIIQLLEYFRSPAPWKLTLIGIVSGACVLSRLPNIFVVPAISFLLLFNKDKGITRRDYAVCLANYLCSSLITIIIILILIYGSISGYLHVLISDKVGSHGAILLAVVVLKGIYILMKPMGVSWCCYQMTRISFRKNRLLLIAVLIFTFLVSFGYLYYEYTPGIEHMYHYVNGLTILLAAAVMARNRGSLQKGRRFGALTVILLSCTPFVGSNTCLMKYLSYPAIPILMGLIGRDLTRPMKLFGSLNVIVLLVYSYWPIREESMFKPDMTSGIKLTGGVFEGMYSKPEMGEKIMTVYHDFLPYKEKDYNIIVLRDNVFYIWEYIFLARNEFIGSNFSYFDAYDKEEYAHWMEEKITNNPKPAAVLYMMHEGEKTDDDVSKTLMHRRLEQRLEKATEGDGYIIYTTPGYNLR